MLPVVVLSAYARGAGTATAALIGALIGIGSLVTNIPSGILATRIGERRAMLVAAAIMAAGLILCLLDFGTSNWSLAVYGLGVFLIGAAGSVYNLARQSYLTEMVPAQMRARALSTLGGSMRVGIFVGPFLGAGAIALDGLSGAYLVSLAAILVAGVIVNRVPDLELGEARRQASAEVTTTRVLRQHWRLFLTLGVAVLLLQAIRQTRQTVIPLWATHIGLSSTDNSVIYGIAGAIDALIFYPAGKVMDLRGRRWVAVPSVLIMGTAFLLMPLTGGMLTLVLVAMLMGFGNGIGSGIVMTLAADASPAVGRLTFLGVWRELADAGAGLGPLILSVAAGLAGIGVGIDVVGGVGFAAAAALWRWIPHPERRSGAAPEDRAERAQVLSQTEVR